jgi:hypothetical protein
MQKFSASLTLGKASAGNANLGHNNRDFISNNVDTSRICENVIYVRQNVRAAYDELFSESVAEYNSKQKQPCRRIHDYYEKIVNGKREEPFYELVVQFGDMKSAGVDTPNGEIARQLLDDYMRGFRSRNPNLHIVSAVCHNDEATPHLHIDFIPFYTSGRKNGLNKGVSMKAALIEQGFNPQGQNRNQLVLWQDREREVMEQILRSRGYSRDVKNADHVHQTVPEYKQSQDTKRLLAFARKSPEIEPTVEEIIHLQRENSLLQVERDELKNQQQSPWKCFFYSNQSKQEFVVAELDRQQIAYRLTENGFESQEHFVEQIRKIEKQYKPQSNSLRDDLRDLIDRTIMQSKLFDEFVQRLEKSGCEIKRGKYFAVKPKYATNFIRTKSLGVDYTEQALHNRLTHKAHFENNVTAQIDSAKNPDSLEVMTLKTIRHYTVVFAAGVLPVRKIKKKKPFSWTNDEQLDRLADLNRRINSGLTNESLREDFARLEKSVADQEGQIELLKSELVIFRDLYSRAQRCFKYHSTDERDLAVLAENGVTAENYHRITKVIAANENEIAEIESLLPRLRRELHDTVDTLDTLEKVMGGTLVQSLIDEEKRRSQADFIPNGLIETDLPAGMLKSGAVRKK